MPIYYKCGSDKMKDFPDTSKIIWKDRNYLGWNVGDTGRKCPRGLPVIS